MVKKKKKMNKGIKHLLTEKSRVTFRVVSMTKKKKCFGTF